MFVLQEVGNIPIITIQLVFWYVEFRRWPKVRRFKLERCSFWVRLECEGDLPR